MNIGTITGESDLLGPLGSHLKNYFHMIKDMARQRCRYSIENDMPWEQPTQPTHISILRLEVYRPLTDTVSLIEYDGSQFADKSL
jgi:hypothetical protein